MKDANDTPTWTAPTVVELTPAETAEQANLSVAYGTAADNPYDDRDHC